MNHYIFSIMTEDDIKKMYEEMVNEFGNRLPCPEQEPIRFAYYVKLFKYIKQI